MTASPRRAGQSGTGTAWRAARLRRWRGGGKLAIPSAPARARARAGPPQRLAPHDGGPTLRAGVRHGGGTGQWGAQRRAAQRSRGGSSGGPARSRHPGRRRRRPREYRRQAVPSRVPCQVSSQVPSPPTPGCVDCSGHWPRPAIPSLETSRFFFQTTQWTIPTCTTISSGRLAGIGLIYLSIHLSIGLLSTLLAWVGRFEGLTV